MVPVLHAGGVYNRSVAVEKGEGQGPGGRDQGEVRPLALPQVPSDSVPYVPEPHPGIDLLRHSRLQPPPGPHVQVHGLPGNQGDRPVRLGKDPERCYDCNSGAV